jgi:hypothetical protein
MKQLIVLTYLEMLQGILEIVGQSVKDSQIEMAVGRLRVHETQTGNADG